MIAASFPVIISVSAMPAAFPDLIPPTKWKDLDSCNNRG